MAATETETETVQHWKQTNANIVYLNAEITIRKYACELSDSSHMLCDFDGEQ